MKLKSHGTRPLITGNCKTRKGLINKVLRLYGKLPYEKIAEACAISAYVVFTILRDLNSEREYFHTTTQTTGPNARVTAYLRAIEHLSKRYKLSLSMKGDDFVVTPYNVYETESLRQSIVSGIKPDRRDT